MRGKLFISLMAATMGTGSLALADSQAIIYAIENPLRPGAKAPHCPEQVIDGCTFHSVAGDAYAARLEVRPGETWVATTANAGTVTLEPQAQTDQTFQIIRVVPDPAVNADTTVTFDKLTGSPGAVQVIERRRINVMIHPS